MNSSFIITIFLLLVCILLSQATEYYLTYSIEKSNTQIESFENPPNLIKKYLSDAKNLNYLSTPQIQNIYNNSINSAMQIKPITDIEKMNRYLVSLQEKINGFDTPPLNQIIYFCISLPYAFKHFFLPNQTIPIPYNSLYKKMPQIFKKSQYYTQIQILCIQWQQCMLLFVPSTNMGDPRTEVYINVMNQYISQINACITNLLNYSNPVYNIL